MRLAERIAETTVAPGEVALFYLAQAGFALKTAEGTVAFLDPYFTDCCERLFGFRRMIPPLLRSDEIEADVVASTHAHADHLDLDAIPVWARGSRTRFLGAADCADVYRQLGVSEDRVTILREGESAAAGGFRWQAVHADHGDLAPEAIGLVIETAGLTVYNVGDSGYCPEAILRSLPGPVDVMIAPINGQFGNLKAEEACRLAEAVRPRLLLASHFWMFVEHGGDPAAFLEHARKLPEGITALVLAPGERLLLSKTPAGDITFTRETLPA